MSEEDYTDSQTDAIMATEGFYEKGQGHHGLFFKLFDGSICLTSKEVPTEPGWEHEPIKTTNPQTRENVFTYVKRFDKLIVRVVDVNKKRKEFDSGGKITNWNLTVMAGKKRAVVQCVWMDSLLGTFLKKAPNIDFEKPILFGAFTKMVKGKKKQLIRIAQGGSSATSDDWTPVPYYWLKDTDAKGNVILDSEAKGADGTIMPDMEHDEDEDTWDAKAQKKFLQKHFVENTLPKIKAIAERLGLNQNMVVDEDGEGDFPTHTGGPAERQIPVVTERPDNPESTSVNDAMTSEQSKGLRKLCKQVGKDPDELAQKFLDADFDDLSIDGAAYLKYKIEKRIAKARKTDPNAFPEPKEEPKKKKAKAPEPDEDEDEDDWGTTQAPAPAKKKKPRDDDDDEDDDDDSWGNDDQVLKDKDGNVIF